MDISDWRRLAYLMSMFADKMVGHVHLKQQISVKSSLNKANIELEQASQLNS